MSDEQPTAVYPGPPAAEAEGPAEGAGGTWIADAVVAKVAATAAREVDGVADLRGGTPRRGWVRASERPRVEFATGMSVTRVDIRVVDVVPAAGA